ncbi:MAG: glycosyltransferase [Myxococcota bacterium]
MPRAGEPDSPARIGAPEAGVEVSVLVPCLNEELNLPELAHRILTVFERGGFRGELILVDDHSTDGTAKVIESLTAAHPGLVRGCFHPRNLGIAAAWRSAATEARGSQVVIIDADLQYQPEDLLRLRRAFREHSVDVVQGWRSPVGRFRDKRYYLSRCFNWLLNTVFSMRLRDNKSGYLLCAREVFLDLLSYQGRYHYWQSFLMVAAHAKGYSYREVETLSEPRRQGESFLDREAVRASLRSLADLQVAFWEYRVRRRPADAADAFLRAHDRTIDVRPSETRSLRESAHRAALSWTHRPLTRNVQFHTETLRRTAELPAELLQDLQDEKLRRLVRHCYRNVPYYRSVMQGRGLRPEDIRGQDELAALPILTGHDIRRHLYFDILAEGHDKAEMIRVHGVGSTHEPKVRFVDRSQRELHEAAGRRFRGALGIAFGESHVRIRSADGVAGLSRRLRRGVDRLAGSVTLTLDDYSPAGWERHRERLVRLQPKLIEGTAEVLELLADALRGPGPRPAPRAVVSTCQTLGVDARLQIEEALGCRVYDWYGTGELPLIAAESPSEPGHRYFAEGCIVELLCGGRPAGPGEWGDVVVTDLANYCMPLLRYRTGDRAQAMPEGSRQSLGAIEGRPARIFAGTEGRRIPATLLSETFRELGFAVRRFALEPIDEGVIALRLVPGPRFSSDLLESALADLRGRLGPGSRIEVELIEERD